MKRYIFCLLCGLIFFITSCQIGKKYSRPQLDIPYRMTDSLQKDTLTIADMKWWEIYTDTTLQSLIRKTLVNNKDLKIAAAKVNELAALKRISYAKFLPQVNGQVYVDQEAENYGGDNYDSENSFEIKGLVSWEIDLWGNLRWAKDESVAKYLSGVEAQRALQLSIIAEVAQSYFELVALDNELSIVRQTLEARKEGVRLAKIRFEGGLTSETSYQQAQVEYARTATLVPDLERSISLKENEIAFLAGEYPYRIQRAVLPENVNLPEGLPVGLPSDLLERRPDIRKAEQDLIAANAAVGIAYTNMFPRLALTAHLGVESLELEDVIRSPYQFVSANLLAPLFALGKNRAILKAERLAYEQSCYSYEKTVLSAFIDVRNAIVNFNKIKDIYEARFELEQAAKVNVELAQLQYINGVIDYLDLLDAQRGYFDAQIGLSNAIRDKQISLIQLYKALGGGW